MFSLVWGTIRLVNTRNLANRDAASPNSDVALQESFWGFGQCAATPLLVLPVMSVLEGALGKSLDKESTRCIKTD